MSASPAVCRCNVALLWLGRASCLPYLVSSETFFPVLMTTTIQQRSDNGWQSFCSGSPPQQPPVCGLVRCADDPTLLAATTCFIVRSSGTPSLDGIREPCWLLIYDNIISGAVVPSSNSIGLPSIHLGSCLLWWVQQHPCSWLSSFLIGIFCCGSRWELSTASHAPLDLRCHSAPVAAASAVFLVPWVKVLL